MLPKPEKPPRKSSKSPQQLDLVDTIQDGTKHQHKRLWVIFLLTTTIGLSLIFSIYRYLKTYKFSPPVAQISFNLPQVNQNKSTNIFDQKLITAISSSNSWTFSLLRLEDSRPILVETYNSQGFVYDFPSIFSQLSASGMLPDSLIVDTLPQGLNFSEKIITETEYLEHQLLINLPGQNYLLISRFLGTDPAVFRSQLPQLIDSIYWRLQTIDPN
jgi:hypothetical protein